MDWGILKVVVVMSQLVYWMLLRDDGREQVVWNACLNLEVPMREVAVCGRRRKAL